MMDVESVRQGQDDDAHDDPPSTPMRVELFGAVDAASLIQHRERKSARAGMGVIEILGNDVLVIGRQGPIPVDHARHAVGRMTEERGRQERDRRVPSRLTRAGQRAWEQDVVVGRRVVWVWLHERQQEGSSAWSTNGKMTGRRRSTD